MIWIFETTKLKKKNIHASSQKKSIKKMSYQKQPLVWSTSSSWEDILEFKEIHSIIFET